MALQTVKMYDVLGLNNGTVCVPALPFVIPIFAPSRALIERVTFLVVCVVVIIEELKTEVAKLEAQSQDRKP